MLPNRTRAAKLTEPNRTATTGTHTRTHARAEHLLETRIDGHTQIGPLLTGKSHLYQHDQISGCIQSRGDNFVEGKFSAGLIGGRAPTAGALWRRLCSLGWLMIARRPRQQTQTHQEC